MRFLLTISVWVIIVGGVFAYTRQRDRAIAATAPAVSAVALSERVLSLELTPTFNLEKDPFALDTGEETSMLEVRVNGKRVEVDAEQMGAGQVAHVEGLRDLILGENEIFAQASPPTSETDREHGLRIKVLDGAVVLAEKTLWSSAGAQVAGTLLFDLSGKESGNEH